MTKVEHSIFLPAEVNGKSNPQLLEMYPDNLTRIVTSFALKLYMNKYHDLDVKFHPDTPKQGPFVFLTNHDSHLTAASLMAADPYYPPTISPMKSELFKPITLFCLEIPELNLPYLRISGKKLHLETSMLAAVLNSYEAIPVNRDGKDREAVSKLLNHLSRGRVVCIAAEGARSKDGILQPMDSSLVALTMVCARRGYPILPIVEIGTFDALPKSKRFPKHYPIRVRGGKPMDFSQWLAQKSTLEVKTEVAQYMQDTLANLLPEEQRPKKGSRPMWDRSDYITI